MVTFRAGSGAARLYFFLFTVFLVVGLVLVVLGFDLEKVDVWLDRQSGWLDIVGTYLFDAVIFVVGLLCALYAASLFFPRRWGAKADLGGALLAAFIAAWMFYVLLLGGV